jgi:hypothetical protein
MKGNIKWRGRIMIIILFLSVLIFFNLQSSPILTTQAVSGTFSEDFTTTTYMDAVNTNVSGWGTGSIENSRKKPTVVGSISSTLIGNTLDVFVDGNYAYITNQDDGLKVVNITDPTNPNIIGSYVTTDIAQSVFVDGDYVFIADYQGISPQYKNFLILDVTDPTNPIHLGNCTTNFVAGDVARDVVVDGDTAFVANDQGGVSVVDVTDPSNPIRIGERDTAGTSIKLAIAGDYAYVADGTNGLVVIDISNPTSPTITATYSTGISSATNIVVEGNYAYVVDIINGIIVVNITDPNTPTFAGSWSESDASDAYIYGNYLYVTDITDGLSVVDITDPTTLVFIYTLSLPSIAQAIFIEGCYAYLACGSGGFQIVKIADPSTPVFAGSYNTPDMAWSVFVSGDYAYIADFEGGVLIFDISNPSSPTLAGSYNTPRAWNVFVSGDFAYVSDVFGGVIILDISNPSSPTLAGSYDTPGYAQDVVVSGDFAYIADHTSGLLILDISNPSSPTLAGSYDTPDIAQDVVVSGDFAYIADHTSGLQVINISNPSSPTLAGSYDTPGSADGVFVSGDFAYIADYSSGLQVLDISNPSSPTLAGSYDTPGYAQDVVVSGDYAYVADHTSGLQVLEVRKNRARQFVSLCHTQSTVVFSASSATITSATLIASDNAPASTFITYSLSADWGSNWETITPGIEHVFSTEGHITEDSTPTFTWFGINGEFNYLFQLDTTTSFSTPLLNLTLPSSGTSYTHGTPLAADTYYWRVAGIDSEGDLGTFSSYRSIFIIPDTNNPVIDHPDDVPYQLEQTGNSITWAATDTNPDWFNVTLNGFLIEEDVWDGSDIIIDVDGLPLGTHTAVCYVYDVDGNSASDSVVVIVSPIDPPTIDDVADFAYEEGTTGHNIAWHPTHPNPDMYVITRDGTIVEQDVWLGGDLTINIDGLVYGVYTYVCTVNDTEGQDVSDTVIVTVTDNIIPTLNSPAEVIYAEGDTGNNILWVATDTNPGTYIVYKDGELYETDTWISGSSIIISVDGLISDQYNFTIVVVDQAGNSARDTVIVAVTAGVPEFNPSVFLAIVSITVVFIFYYIKRRTLKKS